MLRIPHTQTAVNWRDKLDLLKAVEKEYKNNFSILTMYEHKAFQNKIREIKEQHNKAITDGILAEHENALQKLKRADLKVKSEHKKEIAGWDAARLASEMQVYKMLADQAINAKSGPQDKNVDAGERLEKILNEAQESGDQYKARAACEILKSIQGNSEDIKDRLKINRLAQNAKADLEKIRSTPELEKAYEEAETVYSEYYNTRQELIEVAQDIGEGDPTHPLATSIFSQAIKRVQEIDGEIKIFEPDDPHITGVINRTMKE